jgi:hypothetical protein
MFGCGPSAVDGLEPSGRVVGAEDVQSLVLRKIAVVPPMREEKFMAFWVLGFDLVTPGCKVAANWVPLCLQGGE